MTIHDMEDTLFAQPESVNTRCPSCGVATADIIATVSSGIHERQFLQCRGCGQTLVAPWSNSHQVPAGDQFVASAIGG